MSILHYLVLVGYGYVTVFLFLMQHMAIYHARTLISRQKYASMNILRMGLARLIVTRVMQKFSHLDIPAKYQYLNGITILIFTSQFFYIIVDRIHSPIS